MSRRTKIFPIVIIGIILLYCIIGHTEEFEQRTDFPPMGHTVPSEYIEVENCHGGAGVIRSIELLSQEDFEKQQKLKAMQDKLKRRD